MAGGKVILMGFYKDWILLLENICSGLRNFVIKISEIIVSPL